MKRPKPTAADRPQFRRDVADAMDRLGVKVGVLGPAAVLLCVRAADFDPATNVLWEDEANQIAVRPDVHCSTCKSVVALSDESYGQYSALDKKPRICCTACLPTHLTGPPTA
jgi:hypothetical protein